jgi:hemerythrin
MPIPWSNEYSVGIKEIDKQHQEFIGIIDDLNRSIRLYQNIYGQATKKKILDIFDSLHDYANTHFATEEKYFKEFGFEEAAGHIAEHEKFVKTISALRERIDEDDLKISFELIDFMENWLVGHLNGLDKKYTECFHKHGLR